MTKWIIQNTTTMKVLKIKDIVRTISITHKFDKDKLIAINTSDVENGIMHDGTLTAIEDLKGQFKKTVQKGDILFSEIRPANRRFALVTKDDCADYVVSTKLMVLRKYNNEVDLRYFYYCLTNQPFLDMLQRKAENRIGSFPQITFDLLSEYAFPVPSLSEQEKIANIIFSLDHKIELNKQINDNLEAMAKQLYDYWFVQFDFPNEEGKPYKSSGGAMVRNEKLKREIPQGWSGVSLKDLALTSRNAITPVENEVYQHFSIPSFDACGSYSLDNGSDIKSDKFVLQKGQLLVSKLNPWFNRVVWVPKGTNMIGSTEFVVLNPNNESESGYIYSVIKSPKFIAYCSQAATGTSHSQRRVSPDVLMAFKVGYEQGVVQKYGCLIEKIQKQQAELLSEIAILTKQRDELLPLLMNGQATVNYHLSDD